MALTGDANGMPSAVTDSCAAMYFYARVAHVIIHISGIGRLMARTVAFTGAWVAFVVFAAVALQRAI